MNLDFEIDNVRFNARASAIIYNKDKTKVLLFKIVDRDYFMLPGGRIEIYEDSLNAIKREIKEIEIGLGILPEFRGKHLGSQFEKEFSEYLLNKYPQFDEVVARIENTNLNSINAVKKAGFEHIKDDEYHFKKTQKYK